MGEGTGKLTCRIGSTSSPIPICLLVHSEKELYERSFEPGWLSVPRVSHSSAPHTSKMGTNEKRPLGELRNPDPREKAYICTTDVIMALRVSPQEWICMMSSGSIFNDLSVDVLCLWLCIQTSHTVYLNFISRIRTSRRRSVFSTFSLSVSYAASSVPSLPSALKKT